MQNYEVLVEDYDSSNKLIRTESVWVKAKDLNKVRTLNLDKGAANPYSEFLQLIEVEDFVPFDATFKYAIRPGTFQFIFLKDGTLFFVRSPYTLSSLKKYLDLELLASSGSIKVEDGKISRISNLNSIESLEDRPDFKKLKKTVEELEVERVPKKDEADPTVFKGIFINLPDEPLKRIGIKKEFLSEMIPDSEVDKTILVQISREISPNDAELTRVSGDGELRDLENPDKRYLLEYDFEGLEVNRVRFTGSEIVLEAHEDLTENERELVRNSLEIKFMENSEDKKQARIVVRWEFNGKTYATEMTMNWENQDKASSEDRASKFEKLSDARWKEASWDDKIFKDLEMILKQQKGQALLKQQQEKQQAAQRQKEAAEERERLREADRKQPEKATTKSFETVAEKAKREKREKERERRALQQKKLKEQLKSNTQRPTGH